MYALSSSCASRTCSPRASAIDNSVVNSAAGPCDSSPNQHATAHFRVAGHPVIQSFEPDERWAWCYVDDALLDDVGEALGRSYG